MKIAMIFVRHVLVLVCATIRMAGSLIRMKEMNMQLNRVLNTATLKEIDQTVKSVARAQSKRYFKADFNTVERTALVFVAITAQINVTLLDGGNTLVRILRDIDPTETIFKEMARVGFVLDDGVVTAEGATELMVDTIIRRAD